MAGGAAALAVADWAKADPLCASENKIALTIAADFSNQATLQFTSLASAAIPPPCIVILLRAQSKQWTEHNATGVFRSRTLIVGHFGVSPAERKNLLSR